MREIFNPKSYWGNPKARAAFRNHIKDALTDWAKDPSRRVWSLVDEIEEIVKHPDMGATTAMKPKLKPYPGWVCRPCGEYARANTTNPGRRTHTSTYHTDTCTVCGETAACTEPRDFGYPKFEGHAP